MVEETLNVSGMVRNRRLARAIADASMAGFRDQDGIQVSPCRRGGAAAIIGAVMPSRPLVECSVAAHDRYGRASNPGGPEARGPSRGAPDLLLI